MAETEGTATATGVTYQSNTDAIGTSNANAQNASAAGQQLLYTAAEYTSSTGQAYGARSQYASGQLFTLGSNDYGYRAGEGETSADGSSSAQAEAIGSGDSQSAELGGSYYDGSSEGYEYATTGTSGTGSTTGTTGSSGSATG